MKLAEWQRRFARHRTSGLAVAEFCRREEVEAERWKSWQRQVERLTTGGPRQTASRAVFQAVEIIPRRAVVVRFPGGTTLEIPNDRIDLVRLAIERMAVPKGLVRRPFRGPRNRWPADYDPEELFRSTVRAMRRLPRRWKSPIGRG